MTEPRKLRCAVYTRVSDDAGLEQDFNSLDAQQEAAESYIKSQAHEGWAPVHDTYADGGFSGGSLERPALQRLLQDIRDAKVDVIVVYKVDRLTRSLADFAKLVELFDEHSASFVSVTQAFNTTTSMGRLTLNVLLSFAQFEREVTAERIRDKIAASKKKGIWMGGIPPLGYQVKDRKLVPDDAEAETVRMIFRRYLELGSTLPLLEELYRTGVRTRRRVLSSGRKVGGVPFTRGPLNHLLRNRTYLGELNHHKKSYPAEHEPIVDSRTFEAVQTRLSSNIQDFHAKRQGSDSLLMGKFFDDRGNLMSPTHTRKGGVRYRYYVCRLLIEGRRGDAGTVRTVRAAPVEELVVTSIRKALSDSPAARTAAGLPDTELVKACLERVVIHAEKLNITLRRYKDANPLEVDVPWAPTPSRPKREIMLVPTEPVKDGRLIKNEIRAGVVQAVALARSWLAELTADPALTLEALAKRESRSRRSIQMLLSLNFIAPEIVRGLMTGRLPRGIGISRLTGLPTSWDAQYEVLGLVPHSHET